MTTKKKNYYAKLLPNQCYHIYNHAIGQENLFKAPRNFEYFWERWNRYISPYFSNYAYCLMPNHFHILCKSKTINDNIKKVIEKEGTRKGIAFLNDEVAINVFYEDQFRRFFISYTNSINKQEKNRHGGLFKAKFKRTLVSTVDDFLYFLHYIHHNPIHHDFALDYSDWDYSTYHVYHDQITAKGLSKSPVLKLFASKTDPSGWTGFVESHEAFRTNFKDFYGR